MVDPQHLFVYGTLRTGFPAHHLLAGRVALVARGSVAGRLYDTGRYPAAVASSREGERVRGELFRLPADGGEALLAELDRYEGFLPAFPCRSLFQRVSVHAALDGGGSVSAWTYVFNRSTEGLSRVTSGDYANR